MGRKLGEFFCQPWSRLFCAIVGWFIGYSLLNQLGTGATDVSMVGGIAGAFVGWQIGAKVDQADRRAEEDKRFDEAVEGLRKQVALEEEEKQRK